MKIIYMSDLHIRNSLDIVVPHFNCDVLVLAGDIVEPVGPLLVHCIRVWLTKAKHIVYVPGNHEHWGLSRSMLMSKIDSLFMDINREIGSVRVHRLSKVDIDGVRFVGATLWTEMRNEDGSPADYDTIESSMVDHRRVLRDDFSGHADPEYTASIHKFERDWILGNLDRSGKNVIVTHHVPTWKHCDPRYYNNCNNPAFLSNLDELIMSVTDCVPLWIHGHTHTSFDSMIGSTRVVCNPKGYTNSRTGIDENPHFRSGKHITL